MKVCKSSLGDSQDSSVFWPDDEVGRIIMPIYSNVQSSAKKNAYRSFTFYGSPDAEWEDVLRQFNNPDHVGSYLANYGKAGVREVLVDRDDLDFELPAGYSPTDEWWVMVRLYHRPTDGDSTKAGTGIVTYPCCGPDYGNLIYFTAGYLLVHCIDGLWRYCNDFEIVKIDRYKV